MRLLDSVAQMNRVKHYLAMAEAKMPREDPKYWDKESREYSLYVDAMREVLRNEAFLFQHLVIAVLNFFGVAAPEGAQFNKALRRTANRYLKDHGLDTLAGVRYDYIDATLPGVARDSIEINSLHSTYLHDLKRLRASVETFDKTLKARWGLVGLETRIDPIPSYLKEITQITADLFYVHKRKVNKSHSIDKLTGFAFLAAEASYVLRVCLLILVELHGVRGDELELQKADISSLISRLGGAFPFQDLHRLLILTRPEIYDIYGPEDRRFRRTEFVMNMDALVQDQDPSWHRLSSGIAPSNRQVIEETITEGYMRAMEIETYRALLQVTAVVSSVTAQVKLDRFRAEDALEDLKGFSTGDWFRLGEVDYED